MKKPEMTSGFRAALTQQIIAKAGAERGAAIIAQKQARNRTFGVLVVMTLGGTGLSITLGWPQPVTIVIAIGGGLWAGRAWAGEYFVATLKDLGAGLASVVRAVVRAKKGDGDAP